ncbi:hypothetical protein C6I20_06735 [Aeromicrobium sp. A1-2]|uniref:hypothetical protein n=1 Tax=Aeromicrobium sp. A1-2 TaxID=2107713 RepID=UPI000E4B2DD8|nr:hypothetical protein [Aeromicrobium sp. A1-2]AXT84915.1 hypothetical protein C6I20_06735 [Aeromicrobium sp. A1-2]
MTTDERIAQLESRLNKLSEDHAAVTRQLAQAHVDQWQGRIDDLELQVHLGATEATDRLEALTSELQTRWSKARRQMEDASSTTSAVAETLRTGVENAYKELRTALLDSRKKLT